MENKIKERKHMLMHYIKRYIVGITVLVAAVGFFIFFQREENKKVETAQTEQDPLNNAPDNSAIETEDTNETDEIDKSSTYMVDVKGEVTAPGVYEMKEDNRVEDAIDAAEGFTKEADEMQINLSEKVHDEMLIYVPEEGKEQVDSSESAATDNAGDDSAAVRINQASLEEIESLNGIGPSKAEAILQHIEENGPLKGDEDFLEISGIGEKTLENFKDEVAYH